MPTANRPEYVHKAIASFSSQAYADKELIILDDGKEKLQDIPKQENIRYIYDGPIRKAIPKKLNTLCDLAEGEIIARFDDDDYSAPDRLKTQLKVMREENIEFTGFNCILFYDVRTSKVYRYFSSRNFACGTSFMFTKWFWEKYKFDEIKMLSEDNDFIRRTENALFAIDGEKLMVARIHSKTSCTKTLSPEYGFTEVSKDALPVGFIN